MADDVRDALAKFVIGGKPIQGESSAGIAKNDDLALGFLAGSQTNNWLSNFFQVKTFKMDMGLLGDNAADPVAKANQEKANLQLVMQSFNEGEDGKKLGATRSGSDFATFTRSTGRNMKSYSSNLESVTLTKVFDLSSLALFTACTACTVIDQATLIKRRGGGREQLSTYLRIDFTNLLITDFNWDEDDVITEKITFICRSATVKYRVEKSSGELGATLPEQKWSAETNLK